jgi:uncharacterized SAM-binding protein YcdF (DUF218 family)
MGQLPKLKLKRFSIISFVIGAIIIISVIPIRLAIARYQMPRPQAIFVLGGSFSRIKFTAQFFHSYPHLDIWVSDYDKNFGSNSRIFKRAGVPKQQIHYDFCATDTVTNFTCLVNKFKEKNLKHLYLVTSDYHMNRAMAIAITVLGSRGITVTPVSVPSANPKPESPLQFFRDSIRSIVWILTGRTGASFNPEVRLKTKF